MDNLFGVPYSILFIVTALFLVGMIYRNATHRDAAYQDPLTKMANRRAGERLIGKFEQRRRRWGKWWQFRLVLGMVDVDHFKKVNDTHGHDAGDAVLKSVASILRACCRSQDGVFRMGGEEFLISFPDVDPEEALVIAERVRAALETTIQFGASSIRITASLGLAACSGETTILATVAAADKALYVAKERGRNQVVVATPEMYGDQP